MLLQTISVANWLQDKLNAISESQNADYKFKIFGDIGYNKASNEIKGVLKAIKGDIEPLKNDIDIEYAFVCELSVPSQNANFDIINVRKLIDELIVQQNATSDSLDDGDCLFTFSTTLPKDYKIEYGVGTITPLYFVVYVRYTQNAVTSANKHWFLNEFEIPFLTESVLLDKDGMLNKISGENYSKALITGQTKFYKFTFQYDTKNDLCIGLQKDILNGDFEKTYTLKYYDGVAYTEQEPFTATVSIYKNADSGVERTKTGMFNVTFVDADNGDNQTKYYLALIDTPFDMSGENTRNFIATADKTAKQVQIEYFESQVLNGAGYEQIKAPNLNSIDITSQIYRNTNNYDLFDLVNKNYAIIKIEKNGTATRYYYYFVKNASIGAGNQVVYDLKLDTLQTYFFDDNINFAECMIEKAHLNRFVEDTTYPSEVIFDATPNSQLFEREEVGNIAKRLIHREKLLPKIDNTENSQLNNFINENIECWVYCFMTTGEYSFNSQNKTLDGFKIKFNETSNNFKMPYVCFVYPILKNNAQISIYYQPTLQEFKELGKWNFTAFDLFLKNNDGESKIYSLKISQTPPFNLGDFVNVDTPSYAGKGYKITDNIFLSLYVGNNSAINDEAEFGGQYFYSINENYTILSLNEVDSFTNSNTFEDIVLDKEIHFLKSEITQSNKNKKYNPKLLGSDFLELNITDNNNSFNYDFQKINKNTIKLIYNEAPTVDITRHYIRYMPPDENGIYISDTIKNFTGLVGSQDNSLPYAQNQLDTFLANNKNFYMQRNLNVLGGLGQGLVGGALTGGGNLAVTAIMGALSAGSTYLNSNMTLDNMRNSPESLAQANGNAIFNASVTSMGIYLEIYEALDNELEIANDYMFKNGFTLNRLGNIKDYTNIRKYFNYVRARLDAISGVAMSNTARTDLTTRFANGVRFWNSDDIQYEKENYENWLEN